MAGRLLASALAAALLAGPTAGIVLGQSAQIAGLSDVAFGTWPGAGDLERDIRLCVRRTGPGGGTYDLLAGGAAVGQHFAVVNGVVSLPFSLSFNDGSGWREVPGPNSTLTGLRGAERSPAQFNNCLAGQGTPERLRIRFLESDLAQAPAGQYAGTLILTVSPQ
ncbi:hypothetical protein D3874_12900 [Oleomonas cavernae]|uniref:Spore coat protein U domain-containing protein n=1 Tax=Oleomonas cavernae TaxID=2320859 RepID=A0A418WCQ4_9PROT|nr:hypothetical protein [Oleomonas cavernae]RJF87811.1 hypothetical protein D3874_12900 [Oleomonas cavernae]